MNLAQYLALKSELAAVSALVQAIATQTERLADRITDLEQRRPLGLPRKDNGQIERANG